MRRCWSMLGWLEVDNILVNQEPRKLHLVQLPPLSPLQLLEKRRHLIQDRPITSLLLAPRIYSYFSAGLRPDKPVRTCVLRDGRSWASENLRLGPGCRYLVPQDCVIFREVRVLFDCVDSKAK